MCSRSRAFAWMYWVMSSYYQTPLDHAHKMRRPVRSNCSTLIPDVARRLFPLIIRRRARSSFDVIIFDRRDHEHGIEPLRWHFVTLQCFWNWHRVVVGKTDALYEIPLNWWAVIYYRFKARGSCSINREIVGHFRYIRAHMAWPWFMVFPDWFYQPLEVCQPFVINGLVWWRSL